MTAYSIYEVLKELVNKVPWHSEENKQAAIDSIIEVEQLNVFGSTVVAIQCMHTEIGDDGRCNECGRRMQDPTIPYYSQRKGW